MPGPGSGDSSENSDNGDDRAATSPTDGAEASTEERTSRRDDAHRDGDDAAATERAAVADGSTRDRPDPEPTGSNGVSIEEDGVVRWFLNTDDGTVVVIRDVASSVAVVALVGLLLFAVSGIWPPLVAVESGSMEPNMQRGDLVFVVSGDRFVGDDPTAGTGVVTYRTATENGHEKFGGPGDVIVFKPDGSEYRTPVIHRAHFWVEEDENWVETKANQEALNGATCDQLSDCPAPHDGFVTKGDANGGYDQAHGGAQTTIVKPEWVTGKGMFRIPWLGHVRLTFDTLFGTTTPAPTPILAPGAPASPVAATGATPAPTIGVTPSTAPEPDSVHHGPGVALGACAVVGGVVLGRRVAG